MSDVKAIAFYLPQFHPIPENDLWWGKGFTEWTNVSKAAPLFSGHTQPHLPGELGFYDLRVPEVRAQQAALARKHGIHGFCYYYYWFNGKRLLERPLDEMVKSGQPDFPFCICWANENWTRRWDGAEHEILMKQEHSRESDERFITDALPILKDRRYIRVDDAPLLIVYRADILPDAKATTDTWRAAAAAAGIPRLHLCAVQSFGLGDPRPLGFDSACEFPPHSIPAREITAEVKELDPKFTGKIYDYRDVVRSALRKPAVDYLRFRGVMTAWDNSARRGLGGHVYHHASPREYELWLRAVVAESAVRPPEQRIVFINAWNEWAEGTHLEPDVRNGYAYLEATASALAGHTGWREVLRASREQVDAPASVLRQYLRDLEFALEGYERSVQYLQSAAGVVERIAQETQLAVFTDRVPARLKRGAELTGQLYFDRVKGGPIRDGCTLRRSERVSVEGWAFAPGLSPEGDTHAYFVLRSRADRSRSYFAPLLHRHGRDDVARHHAKIDPSSTLRSGFSGLLWFEQVPAGEYDLGVVHASASRVVAAFAPDWITLK